MLGKLSKLLYSSNQLCSNAIIGRIERVASYKDHDLVETCVKLRELTNLRRMIVASR